MFSWIKETLIEIENDSDIIWKAIVMHHPVFGLQNKNYKSIINNLEPLLKEYEIDLVLSGHDHLLSYAYSNINKKEQFN